MKKIAIASASFLPFLALAAVGDNIAELIGTLQAIVNGLVPIVITAALLFFFWGLAKYILSSGDDAKKKEGKNIMIWGLLALFVMVSVWGLIGFIQKSLGLNSSDTNAGSLDLIPDSVNSD